MTPSDRAILERAVAAISEQAVKASGLIDEAMDAGLPADHPVTVAAKLMQLELLEEQGRTSNEGWKSSASRAPTAGGTCTGVSGLGNAAGHLPTPNRRRIEKAV